MRHTKFKFYSSYTGYGLVAEFNIFGWIYIHHCFIRIWQWIIGIDFVVLLVIYFLVYLSILCPYVACSNLMGGGVPTPISDHIAVRLLHYSIVIQTRMLYQIHLRIFHTPTLIYETYYLLLPPAHGHQGWCWEIYPQYDPA